MTATGATKDQVTAAEKRISQVFRNAPVGPLASGTWQRHAELALEGAVPEGMVIASASDVVSPEQRAAIGRMSASLDDLLTDYDDASAEQSVTDRALNCLDSLRRFANKVDRSDDLAVLRAIVGGQGE